MPTVRHPVIYSATPPSYPLPPPALDEHGDEIRAWLAGPPGRRRGRAEGPQPRIRREREMTQPGTSPASRPRWAPPTRTRSPCSARTSPPT